MADNNLVTLPDGRTITYQAWKVEQALEQEAVLKNVNDLITNDATNAMAVGATFDQQEYGALLRQVIPILLDQYGNINATAAKDYYDQLRAEYVNQNLGSLGGNAGRYARARFRGAFKVSEGYTAQYAETYNVVAKTDAVVNWAMKVRAQSGQAPSIVAMNNALTREVAMYHRDTVLFNSGLDPLVSKVQRVAQANACAFCRLMALGSTRGTVRVGTYAAKYHDNCHCTISPLFPGDQPVRPAYYDAFEKQYDEATPFREKKKTNVTDWRDLLKSDAYAETP